MTVICADPESERLSVLTARLREEGFLVSEAHSASECLSLAASQKPDAVVLDYSFLHVDLENVAAYIRHLSRETFIVLLVNQFSEWQQCPDFVQSIAEHGDSDYIVTILRHNRSSADQTI
jgi:DNA-binding response OmpR family regulator